MSLVQKIDALLPQTQCGECSYAGCLPYAEALAQGLAEINRCPPGGLATVKALGNLLNIDSEPYLAQVQQQTRAPSLASIRESECIGCTKCIKACPVDAIIGSAKLMHAIISHECTGCGLCVEPCPVDCIDMIPQEEASYDKDLARNRYHAKQTRMLKDEHQRQQLYREKKQLASQAQAIPEAQAKKDYILQALERVKAKRHK